MYIAIDIGATNIRVAQFDDPANPQLLSLTTEKNSQDYQEALQKIKNIVGDKNPTKIGVGAPRFTNLQEWRNHDLKVDLEKLLDCQVVLANDVAAAASGEIHYGQSGDDFLFVSWGTGIGGAVVRDKKIWTAEIGHQIIITGGKLCTCGQKGCLEAYCGGSNLKSDDLLPSVVPYFAQGLVNCMAISPVPLIVFAGGLAMHQPKILLKIEMEVKNILKIMDAPDFKLATFGEQAGIYGALSLLKSTL